MSKTNGKLENKSEKKGANRTNERNTERKRERDRSSVDDSSVGGNAMLCSVSRTTLTETDAASIKIYI